MVIPNQYNRWVHTARSIAAAEEPLGSQDTAATSLRHPTTALAGDPPLSLLDTSEGALLVEDLLAHIDHALAV